MVAVTASQREEAIQDTDEIYCYIKGYDMSKSLSVIIIILMILFVFNSCTKKPMTLEELKIFNNIDTIHNSISRVFLVDHFCFCTKDVLKFDSIACSLMQSKLSDFSIGFFTKSDITNIENLEKFPKDFGRYSLQNDIVVHYKSFNDLPYFSRYDYYIDKENILEIERKLICKDGKAVEYTGKYK